jgi:hypothetical protein
MGQHGAQHGYGRGLNGYFVSGVVGLLLGLFTTGIPIASWGRLSIATSLFGGTNAPENIVGQFLGRVQLFFAIALLCWSIRFFSLGIARLPVKVGSNAAVTK